MRRTLLPLAAAVALGATVTACGDSDDGASACSPADSAIEVAAKDELKFDADSYDAGAGCIEVTYRNDGSVPHTLLVKGKDGFKLSIGEVDTGTIELAAGRYTLYCDIAGHEAAGMSADLNVG